MRPLGGGGGHWVSPRGSPSIVTRELSLSLSGVSSLNRRLPNPQEVIPGGKLLGVGRWLLIKYGKRWTGEG